MKYMNLLICLLVLAMGSVCCTGCVATSGGVAVGVGYPQGSYHQTAPPAYAPAPVNRYKHRYWYYPDSYVYYDTARRVYFYLAGDAWRVSVSLPSSIQVNLNDRVALEMDTDKPYRRFQEHRKKFPPGRMKKGAHKKTWGYPQAGHRQAPPAKRYGPPAKAPVSAHRYKHRYWYYPDSYVYYDTARRVYFYLAGNAWRVSASLPRNIQMNRNHRIALEMDTDRPYSRFQEHRKKFPPEREEKKRGKRKKEKKW